MRKMPWEFEDARCSEVGVEVFFNVDADEPNADKFSSDHYKEAKKICSGCIHIQDCALWGIENEIHGVWGGTTPNERKKIRRSKRIKTSTTLIPHHSNR